MERGLSARGCAIGRHSEPSWYCKVTVATALDEFAEMRAGGRRRHSRFVGQHGRRERTAVAERKQHASARGVGDQGADTSDICISAHTLTVARR